MTDLEHDAQIFRKEAIEHHLRPTPGHSVLMIVPRWTRWTYALVIALLIVATGFVYFPVVGQYANGPALVRAKARTELASPIAGIISAVETAPNAAVQRGQVLARLRSTELEAEVDSLRRAFSIALAQKLATGAAVDASMLRSRIEILEAEIRARTIVASVDGIIGEVRAQDGKPVDVGDVLFSIIQPGTAFTVIGFLPGESRPALEKGDELQLELGSVPGRFQTLTVTNIDDEIVGPAAVRRLLGEELADSVPLSGTVFRVYAELPGTSFTTDGETYKYFDGMPGRVRGRLRADRLIRVLIPGMDRLRP